MRWPSGFDSAVTGSGSGSGSGSGGAGSGVGGGGGGVCLGTLTNVVKVKDTTLRLGPSLMVVQLVETTACSAVRAAMAKMVRRRTALRSEGKASIFGIE
jgi:hypothetical protein